jgi:hypothetical protein
MTPWFKNVTPHQVVRDGVPDESVFAADLSEVAIGKGRPVYAKPELFFSKTYLTLGLRTICKRVIDGLNGKIDSGDRAVSLQTGFGGGKTHSLIALYHIAKQGKVITKLDAGKQEYYRRAQQYFVDPSNPRKLEQINSTPQHTGRNLTNSATKTRCLNILTSCINEFHQ